MTPLAIRHHDLALVPILAHSLVPTGKTDEFQCENAPIPPYSIHHCSTFHMYIGDAKSISPCSFGPATTPNFSDQRK